jgi:hypothetical protein
LTLSRQVTGDTTNLPFIQYCARVSRNSGETSTSGISLSQSLETIDSTPFVGKTVTLSFYARRGANFSAASNALTFALYGGTGTDQNIVSGYTGFTSVGSATATLTTTWQRFQLTATVGTTLTELATYFEYVPSGTAGAADFFEMTGVQLEIASSASAYSPATPTYATELAACQRYYYQAASNTLFGMYGWFFAYNTTTGRALVQNPVPMRTAAISVTYSNLTINRWGSGTFAFTTLTIQSTECNSIMTTIDLSGSSGLSANGMYQFSNNNNVAGFLGVSAEL